MFARLLRRAGNVRQRVERRAFRRFIYVGVVRADCFGLVADDVLNYCRADPGVFHQACRCVAERVERNFRDRAATVAARFMFSASVRLGDRKASANHKLVELTRERRYFCGLGDAGERTRMQGLPRIVANR